MVQGWFWYSFWIGFLPLLLRLQMLQFFLPGAVLSRDMNKVIEQTVHRGIFQLPAVQEPFIRKVSDELGYTPGVVLIERNTVMAWSGSICP